MKHETEFSCTLPQKQSTRILVSAPDVKIQECSIRISICKFGKGLNFPFDNPKFAVKEIFSFNFLSLQSAVQVLLVLSNCMVIEPKG
jgi:hypothetical protein